MIHIYTDGSASPNPGKGTGAFIVIENDQELFRSSFTVQKSTNNRMEMWAVFNALQFCIDNTLANVIIYTDSQYVQKGITKWIIAWKAKNYLRNGQPIPNMDLWKALDELYSFTESIKIEWVKGHADNKWNNAVDQLCTEQYKK